jgi:hypothetical protein
MDRRYRVRIVIGVWIALLGLALTFIAPSFVIMIPHSWLGQAEVSRARDGISTQHLAAAACAIVGVIMLLIGVLFAAISWSKWFIRSSPPGGEIPATR